MKRINLTRILYIAAAAFTLQTAHAQSVIELDSAAYARERQAQELSYNREQGSKSVLAAERQAAAEAQKRADQERFESAMEHLLMKRYRTPDVHEFTRSLFGHLSIGAYTDRTLAFITPNRNVYTSEYDFHWGAFAQKDITSAHGIRLQYDFGRMSMKDGGMASRHQLGLDYLWNLSNYFYGYNESRPWTWSYLVGLNVGANGESALVSPYYAGLHTGIQLRANLSPRTYIFAEPRIAAYTNESSADWHKVDVRSHILFGMGARLTSPYKSLQWDYSIDADSVSWTDNFFLQLSMGAFDSYVDLSNGAKEMGPSFHFAAGRWLNPKLALRASLYAEQLNKIHRNRRAGGMVEGVVSIPHLFGFSMGRWGLEASAGMRYDRVCWALGQWGSTTALQLKYFVNQQFALFADTRYSSMFNDETGVYDDMGNLNLGVEFYRSNYDRYRAKVMTMGDVAYRQGYFASAGYGVQYPFLMGGDWLSSLNNTYHFSLGYRFDDYNALRLKFENTDYKVEDKFTNTLIKSSSDWMTLSPQYMFNLTNLWLGNTNHRFDLRPYVGPVISLTEADYFGHGIEVGMPVVWKLAPGLELFVEPSYRYMSGEALKQCILYDKGMWSMTGGINYVQGPLHFREYIQRFNWGKDWFVAAYGGLQKDDLSTGHADITALPVGNVAVGRWFGPIGARVSAFASLNRTYQEPYLFAMGYAGARLEGMVNLTSLFAPTKEVRRFEIDALGGYHSSVVYRPLPYYAQNWAYADGPTAALQFKYYVGDGIGVFVEPRRSWISYDRTELPELGGQTKHFTQKISDLSIGLEVRQHNLVREDLRRTYGDFQPRNFISGDLGLSYPMNYTHVKPASEVIPTFGPLLGLSFGRELNALSTVRYRMTANHFRSHFTDERENGFNNSFEYMLNITNGMLGYDPSRIMDFKAIVGVDALFSTYKNKTNLGAHLGAQLSFRTSEQMSVYAEANMAMYHNPTVVEGMRIIRNKGLMPYAAIGSTFYYNAANMPNFEFFADKRWFIDVYAGRQADLSILGKDTDKHFGPVGGIAIGKMYGPMGWRVGGFLSNNRKWSHTSELMAYGGLRLEGMVDLFQFIKPIDEERKFTINAFGGIQPCIAYRPYYEDSPYTRNRAYAFGPTGALQAVWQLGRIALFAEPRLTWLDFKRERVATGASEVKQYTEFSHELFEFNVGVRLRQHAPKETVKNFEPKSFISLEGGLAYPVHYKGETGSERVNGALKHLGGDWGIGYGRHFTANSGVRVKVDRQYLLSQYAEGNTKGWRFGVDYMSNFSNLLWGYDSTRKVDVYGTLGASYLYTNYKDKFNFGLGGGLNVSMRINDNMRIHLEPHCDFYRDEPSIIEGQRLVHFVGTLPTLNAGITYEF